MLKAELTYYVIYINELNIYCFPISTNLFDYIFFPQKNYRIFIEIDGK